MFVLREFLFFINKAIFVFALVPLIVKNYRLKTSRGVSDGLTFSLLNGFIGLTIYSACLNLPYAYSIGTVPQILMVCVLIWQRFSYDSFLHRRRLALIYFLNLLLVFCVVPLAYAWPKVVGHVCGWVMFFFFFINRIPQMIKIQRERSVYGFSYGFALLLGLAAAMEFVLVLVYDLPLQTMATAIWAFIGFLIFTGQFYAFSWRRKVKK